MTSELGTCYAHAMPKVVVYVPAAAWRRLEQRGLDPAATVREFARQGYELSDGTPVPKPPPLGPALVNRSGLTVIEDEIKKVEEADLHFKPDFKKGKK